MSTQASFGVLFPGQGSQHAGMNRALMDHFPWTRQVYEEASDACGLGLLKLCLDGPEDELQKTENAQPAILATSYAWFQVLKRNWDFAPQAGAGHSLGEYSALVSAQGMSLAEGVRLVRERGRLMQQAVPLGKGKMAALLGLDDEKSLKLCKAATEGESIVVPANFNAPGQVVIAGHSEAVDRAEKLASGSPDPELKARKFIPLKVSAPFHCPLMKPVGEKLLPSLQKVHWKERSFSVVHNVDAGIRKTGDLVPLLKDQIDHPVLWTRCQALLAEQGLNQFIEMGPGKVLTGLGKRIVDEGTFWTLESLEDLKKLELKLKEVSR